MLSEVALAPLVEGAPAATRAPSAAGAERNRLRPADRAFHDWYRFVLSFPPHLVREYAERFDLRAGQTVLDPFCGTGTTLVECKKLDIRSVGLEPNPMAHFASAVKVDWTVGGRQLTRYAESVAAVAAQAFAEQDVDNRDLPLLAAREDSCAPLRCLQDDRKWTHNRAQRSAEGCVQRGNALAGECVSEGMR